MKILGIETSCDETAASLIEVKGGKTKVLSNIVSSQIKIHQQYGGVVPEVAARNHIKNILPVINKALPLPFNSPPLIRGGATRFAIALARRGGGVDAIAVTRGPGLISSLLIGLETAKSLSYAWNKPLIGVNHMAGHIYANFVNNDKIKFPALALVVSGGHTELVLMRDHLKFKKIGQTRDDAVGEAFDKVAKMLSLGYPGGPIVSKYASKGDSKNIVMPRPMMHDNNFDFSFSGLKTSVLYQIQKDKNYKKNIPNYCAAFQQAVIDVLIFKTLKAAQKYKVKSILLAGGVAANKELRQQLGEAIKKQLPQVDYHVPDLKYTTDNATMIAMAGYYLVRRSSALPVGRLGEGGMAKQKNRKRHSGMPPSEWKKIKVDCNLSL